MNKPPSKSKGFATEHRVLLIDPDGEWATGLNVALASAKESCFVVDVAAGVASGFERLTESKFDIVVFAPSARDDSLEGVLERLGRDFSAIPVTVLEYTRDKERAELAFRFGAQEYIAHDALRCDTLAWALTASMHRMRRQAPPARVEPAALSLVEDRLQEEIQERHRIETMNHGLNRVLEALAEGQPLSVILETLVLTIESQLDRVRSTIMLVDAKEQRLRLGAGPSFDRSFTDMIDGMPIRADSVGCGKAAYLNQTVIAPDLEAMPEMEPLLPMAREQGFCGFWSIPIRSSSHSVLGTLCLYYPEPRKPRKAEVQLIDSLAHLFGIAIEFKNSEQALRDSNERFKKIFSSGPLGMAVLDTEGRFVSTNAALSTMTGYSAEELQELACLDLTHEEDRENSARLTEDLLAGKMPSFKLEKRYVHKTGRVFWLNMTLTAIRHQSGDPLYIIAMYENIDERKRAEEELVNYRNRLEELVAKRTEALQATNQRVIHVEKLSAIGKLAASIAHEFNNPIYGIRNVLEKVENLDSLDQKHKGFVGLAIKECQRIATLISKLQDFNRPSSGAVVSMDVHEALDEMGMLIHRKLAERHIELKKEYAKAMPKINAVPDQIRQVFLNLLQNAEEAIPENGGLITLKTRHDSNTVRISIRDSGLGIAAEHIGNIFDPFFTTKPAVKGTGLGLSTSYGIVKIHRGDITVTSEPGKGTEFTVALPIHMPLEKLSTDPLFELPSPASDSPRQA